MTQSYDVIIVGAGPGGAIAANILGQSGCRVLVLERQRLPRYKPCAGGLPGNVLAGLPAACGQAVERWVTHACFLMPGEGEVRHAFSSPVAMVARERFDYLLLSQADATVHDGEGAVEVENRASDATVRTSLGERYRAACIVGADGAFSLVARAVGLRKGLHLGPALEAEVGVGEGLLERYADTSLFLLGTVPGGYVWVFPKADHLSFGAGAERGSGRELRRVLHEAALLLDIPVQAVHPRGHALPAYRRNEQLQRGRVLLVGDAAGLLDPLSGEGIRHALRSGRLAAEAILAGDLSGYTHRVHQEIGRHLGAGRWLAHAFYGLPRLSFRLGARNPVVIGGLLRMLNGEVTYADLIGRIPGYLLRWLSRG